MKMTEEQILKLIAGPSVLDFDGTVNDVLGGFVRQLAAISEKLDQDDLALMMNVGMSLYQLGLREFKEGVDADALFEHLAKKKEQGEGQ